VCSDSVGLRETEHGTRTLKPFEWALFGLALAGCAVGIHRLVQGYISVWAQRESPLTAVGQPAWIRAAAG